MAQDSEESLMKNFCNGFNERDKNISKLPLHQQFKQIKILLERIHNSSSSSSPSSWQVHKSSLTESLRNLNIALADCKKLSRKVVYTEKDLFSINTTRMKLNQLREELIAIKKRSAAQEEANSSQTRELVTQLSTRSVDATKVFGFDGKAKALEKLLLGEESEDRFKAIGMVGMKGIGKTTLCQVIFDEPEVKSYFLPRIWICLSRMPGEDPDPAQRRLVIARRMLKNLGANKEILESPSHKDDLAKLLYSLNLQLRGKRYLIVLDGAADNDNWYKLLNSHDIGIKKWSDRLAYGLPKGHGGAVIVTSRSQEVAEMMVGAENLYRVLPLPDTKSCWSIFKNSVKEGNGVISNKEDLKKDIKKKCAGVPLAAKLMGQIFCQDHQQKSEPSEAPKETVADSNSQM